MAQFNPNDPRYQRDQQKAAAKRSMGPQRLARAEVGEISGRHAGYQLGRQQLFERLGIYGKGREQSHELSLAGLKQGDRRLSILESNLGRDKKALGLTTGFGLLGMGLSDMEGRRRKNLLAQDRLSEQEFRRNYQLQRTENMGILKLLLKGKPIGSLTNIQGGL
jgi:hypothetical protein